MKIAPSTIRDIHAFPQRRDPLLDVNGGGRRLSFSRYGPLDLASLDQSWPFSHGRREKYCPCNICHGCYVFDNGDSYSRLASDVDKDVRLFSPGILVWVLLPMMIDYFNGYARARGLGIAAQTKIMGEPSMVFSGMWFNCL
jgi:hypothetical protein